MLVRTMAVRGIKGVSESEETRPRLAKAIDNVSVIEFPKFLKSKVLSEQYRNLKADIGTHLARPA